MVNIKTAIVFGIPSIAAIFLTRQYLLPAIPQHVFTIESFIVTKNILLMLLFAILMIAASYSMIKKTGRQMMKHCKSSSSITFKFSYKEFL
ncbi:hypothetical protein LWM68_10425 [Niabella sp. W65]|nr:hypothetical protein [Niabella sp. W65]MCH7363142.1 hypothetical protein [Niabella sp. W65]ULT39070.1 hypothetical protein KRR40_29135 [Niabella sp. I65]